MHKFMESSDTGSAPSTQTSGANQSSDSLSSAIDVDINLDTNILGGLLPTLSGGDCDGQSASVDASVAIGAEIGLGQSEIDCVSSESGAAQIGIMAGSVSLEAFAPDLLGVTVGGAELGHLLDGGTTCGTGNDNPALQVDVLDGDHLLDAHVSNVADATVDLGGLNGNDCGC